MKKLSSFLLVYALFMLGMGYARGDTCAFTAVANCCCAPVQDAEPESCCESEPVEPKEERCECSIEELPAIPSECFVLLPVTRSIEEQLAFDAATLSHLPFRSLRYITAHTCLTDSSLKPDGRSVPIYLLNSVLLS